MFHCLTGGTELNPDSGRLSNSSLNTVRLTVVDWSGNIQSFVINYSHSWFLLSISVHQHSSRNIMLQFDPITYDSSHYTLTSQIILQIIILLSFGENSLCFSLTYLRAYHYNIVKWKISGNKSYKFGYKWVYFDFGQVSDTTIPLHF